MCAMRATDKLSNDLFRPATAAPVLLGRKFDDRIGEGLQRVLDQAKADVTTALASLDDLMQDFRGVAEPTPLDFASNSAHLDGFGR